MTIDNKKRKIRIGYQSNSSPDNNIISYLHEHIKNFPDRVALKWVESSEIAKYDGDKSSAFNYQQITYKQFAMGINSVAAGLRGLGIEKGDRVIIFLPMGLPMYTAMFAVQKLGAIAVFLDSWARKNHLGASADCVKPKAMISHKAAFDLVNTIEEFSKDMIKIIGGPGHDDSYDAQLEMLFKTQGDVKIEAVEREETPLITFTTGSSGTPKGANRTHRFLSAQHEALSEVVPYNDKDLDMPAFPIFSLNNLASGVSTLMPAINLAAPSKNDSAAMVKQLIELKVSCATLSPSMLNGVSEYCIEKGIKLTNLRRVVTGGAPISRDNVRDFKSIAPSTETWVLYGSTEVEPMAHIEADEMLSQQLPQDTEVVERGVNVGHISNDLEYKFIKIVREPIDLDKISWSDLVVKEGEVGEFIVTGDHVCREYYNNKEAFFKSKIMDHDKRVWHRTGDLARQDESGFLWIVGRIHNVIERKNEYFFPVRAEILLKRIDGVSQAAFLGMDDENLGQKNAIAVSLKSSDVDSKKVAEEVKRLFKKNNIPVDSIYEVAQIPMDPRHHSKVEYGILRDSILNDKIKDLA